MKREKDLNKLGRLLRRARQEQGITLKVLHEKAGVSEGGIVGLEHAQYRSVDPDKLRSLAAVLKLNSRDLFAIAGLLPDEEQPTISGLMHVQYRSLPDEAVDEIQNFVDYQVRKHDADDHPGNTKQAS